MSTYAWVKGELSFKTEKDYQEAKAILENGGWINKGKWFNEANEERGDFENLKKTIIIPEDFYRNLTHVLNKICALSSSYNVKWASTDGQSAVVELDSNGEGGGYSIEEYAKKNGLEQAPQLHECDSEDEYYENLDIWQQEIIQDFLDDK